MKTLKNFVGGSWQEAQSGFVPLFDPCSEEPIARASSAGIDFGAALAWARRHGAALRGRTFAERGAMLEDLSRALSDCRDELLTLSLRNTGTTRKDAKFDVDGAIFTLAHYGQLGRALGARTVLADGEGVQLGRSARFWGQHLLVPLDGVALHINAFNFPAWGFAEKAACAWLAGMPVITKPATSSALVAARCVEIVLAREVLPEGALSLICGSTGDLLGRLGAQDVVAFTGSARTGLELRSMPALLGAGTRFNLEADSLNAAVLGPDVEVGSETWSVFLQDVAREMTQKSGQKCTAVRRILVPADHIDAVEEALCERLAATVVGNPEEASVTMGPLATAAQLGEAVSGIRLLREETRLVLGSGERVDGVGNPAGKGWFLAPALLRAERPDEAERVHHHEVFGPVATLMSYDGSTQHAAALVARGGGMLVTSLYVDDRSFLGDWLARAGSSAGRLYLGSEKVAAMLPGSGVAMPALRHGGPGRAGGGSELGGLRGLELYLERVAVSGDRALVERLAQPSEV